MLVQILLVNQFFWNMSVKQEVMKKMKVRKYKDENIFFNYKHYLSCTWPKNVLFQTQKRSYVSRNMENSWVSIR